MSAPGSPAPTARVRPGSVTIASYLLYLTAVLFAASAIITFSTLGTLDKVFTDAYAGTAAEGTEGFVIVVSVVGAVVQLVIALALVVLALLNNQGRNAARITTWVVGGLGLCCAGLGLAGNAVNGMGAGSTGTSGDLPDAQAIQDRLEAELPSWSGPLTLVFSIVMFLALLGAIILLALPASNSYFKRPAAGWEPPVPGAAYPGQQPPYPGQQPPSGADPGYPPQGPAGPPNNPPTS